jgi:class 3 adenylate cyclase
MRCPSCGFENPEDLKFCNECGAPLRMPCSQCGFANQPQAKFCGECGTALPPRARASTAPPLALRPHAPLSYTPAHLTEKILQSKAALEGERKQVTVLFADLRGSMELLADRDPEDARQLLDPVLERMMAAVHRYEGTVNQVMGDGIMALFGAPIAHEDHAQRALYTALHMQEEMRRYADKVRLARGVPLQIRVRLNTGEVVVRSIRTDDLHTDYAPIGTRHLMRTAIDVGAADTRTAVCLLPRGMEHGKAPVATHEEATPEQQATPLHNLTPDTPDRRPCWRGAHSRADLPVRRVWGLLAAR